MREPAAFPFACLPRARSWCVVGREEVAFESGDWCPVSLVWPDLPSSRHTAVHTAHRAYTREAIADRYSTGCPSSDTWSVHSVVGAARRHGSSLVRSEIGPTGSRLELLCESVVCARPDRTCCGREAHP